MLTQCGDRAGTRRPLPGPRYLEDAVHVDHDLGPLGRIQRRAPQHLLLVLQQALADGVYLGHLRGGEKSATSNQSYRDGR